MRKFFDNLTSSEGGFAQWVILIVLLFGIGVGVFVAQVRTNLVPQAKVEVPVVQSTAIMLKALDPVILNNPVRVGIYIRSDIDPVRLVTVHLKYDPQAVEVLGINTPIATMPGVVYATVSADLNQKVPFVSQWLETLFNNSIGSMTVTGLFGEGDFKTELNRDPFEFTTFVIRPKTVTPSELVIEDSSLMLRGADNANILLKVDGLHLAPKNLPTASSGKK